jgi:hypothetical protein
MARGKFGPHIIFSSDYQFDVIAEEAHPADMVALMLWFLLKSRKR